MATPRVFLLCRPGRGAAFTIRLPFDRGAEAEPQPESGPSAASQTAGLSRALQGRTVLIVEDHDDARQLVASVIQAAGAVVTSATSTAQALARLAEDVPDLLVADIGLPGEDGYALLQRVRAMDSPAARTLPAVALTAYARPTDRERALAAGFQRYVTKPVDPAELIAILGSILR